MIRAGELERAARKIASLAPFWGPPPGSNRWADLDYCQLEPLVVLAPGEAIQLAINRGWLMAERHAQPGVVLENDPEGGELECRWRYHPVVPSGGFA